MSKYSEKVERRREEEAREAEKAAKAERHAEAEAEIAKRRDMADAVIASRRVVEGVGDAIEALDRAISGGDVMAAAAANGIAKSEALSIRNSLWATREKLRAMHRRAQSFAAMG